MKSRGAAVDIVWGLQQLTVDSKQLAKQTSALARLFQAVDGRDCAAFGVLQQEGISELLRLFETISGATNGGDADTLLFILKIPGLYGTVAGTLKIVEAARQPLKPDGYMWSVILRGFTAGHPEKKLLYDSLREPLPEGFIAVSLLDATNAVLIARDAMAHPFDTAEGKQRLRNWLSNREPEEISYAHSATAALPFISGPEREALLDLAMNHPDSGVQIEAAWAAAKVGREDGIQFLARQCLDFKTAESAKRYLAELGRADAVPAQARDPGFSALAELAQWLAHPNELGRVPDEMVIVDHRDLRWPPKREPRPFWLIKYTVRDSTGLKADDMQCGLVGSVTFCLFSYELAQRPPEDGFAVHCYWEMEQGGLIQESNVQDQTGDYDNLFSRWNGAPLRNRRMCFVAEISPELRYPERLVGLAAAELNGEEGWVVLDGDRSEWYPQSEQPGKAVESVILKVHVGRNLLGFTGRPDRLKYLAPERPLKSPAQIITAYEKHLAEARLAEGKKRTEAFSSIGLLAIHFGEYADALRQMGRAGDIRELVKSLAPEWDHPSGYGKLGSAAWQCGQTDLAEDLFVQYRNRCANYERGEEMGMLAELWCRAGKPDAARDLLLDCLHRLLKESKTAKGSDEALFEKWFQNQRKAFLKLFPEGKSLLASRSIPASTLCG